MPTQAQQTHDSPCASKLINNSVTVYESRVYSEKRRFDKLVYITVWKAETEMNIGGLAVEAANGLPSKLMQCIYECWALIFLLNFIQKVSIKLNKSSSNFTMPYAPTMKQIFAFVIAHMLFIRSVVIDNCLIYSSPADYSKPTCLSCRDGFFVREGNCLDCNVPGCYHAKPAVIASLINNELTAIPTLRRARLLTSTGSASDPSWTQIEMLSSRFENCKEISNGSCLSCLGNYKLSPDSVCVKEQTQPTQDKLLNCLVFSQIENKCLFCDDGFMLNSVNICKADASGKGSPITINNIKIVAVRSDMLLAQNDKVSTLSFNGTQNVSDSSNGSLKKIPAQDGQILFDVQVSQIKTLNTSNSTGESSSAGENIIVSTVTSPPNISNIKVTVIVDNSSQQQVRVRVVEIENDNCEEYKFESTVCIKCKRGYILNPLSAGCVTLNKPIDLSSAISRIIKSVAATATVTINNLTSSDNKTQAVGNASGTSLPNNTTSSTGVNSNANTSTGNLAVANSSTSNATNSASVGNSTPAKTNTTNNTTTTNTAANPSMSNTANATNSTKSTSTAGTTPTTIAAAAAPTVPVPTSSINVNASSPNISASNVGATNVSKTNTSKYNVTVTLDTKTGMTIKTVGTTTNPPAANAVKFCAKYWDITYECVQCDAKYNLYQGKCYDNFEYSQILLKSKKTLYGNTIPG